MCLAIPGEVLSIQKEKALVNIMGVKKEISTVLVEEVQIGDYLVVHAGCAISKIDKIEALETIEIFKGIEDLNHE